MFRRTERRRQALRQAMKAAIGKAQATGAAGRGPPAISLARQCFGRGDGISFAPLETRFILDEQGVRVPAWVTIPNEQIPPSVHASILLAARAFAAEPLLGHIFFLSASYRLSVQDIAGLLGIGHHKARRLLLRAIRRLDAADHSGPVPSPDHLRS